MVSRVKKREQPENWELTNQAYELVNPGTCRFRKIVTASDNQVTLVIPEITASAPRF